MRVNWFSCYVMRSRVLLALTALWLAFGTRAWPQSSTSTALGTVVDTQGGAIAGAAVTLINEGTSDERSVRTDGSGNFLFAGMLPGDYTLKVEHPGFQTYRKQGNALTASERFSLGTIQLNVGSVTDTVSGHGGSGGCTVGQL